MICQELIFILFHADTEQACFQNIISSLRMITAAMILKVEHLSQGRWKV